MNSLFFLLLLFLSYPNFLSQFVASMPSVSNKMKKKKNDMSFSGNEKLNEIYQLLGKL